MTGGFCNTVLNTQLPFLEPCNEPDYSFLNFPPLTSPVDSATHRQPFNDLEASTKTISPAPAWTGDQLLHKFAGNCTGRMEKLGIVAAHVYSVEAQGAVGQIKMLHDRWPVKKIWVTELTPSIGGEEVPHCPWQVEGMTT